MVIFNKITPFKKWFRSNINVNCYKNYKNFKAINKSIGDVDFLILTVSAKISALLYFKIFL